MNAKPEKPAMKNFVSRIYGCNEGETLRAVGVMTYCVAEDVERCREALMMTFSKEVQVLQKKFIITREIPFPEQTL